MSYLNAIEKLLSEVCKQICPWFYQFREARGWTGTTDQSLNFYFKSYFNELEFNIGPYVEIDEMFFFSQNLDLIEHKSCKLCMNNQMSDTWSSGEPLVYQDLGLCYCEKKNLIYMFNY